MIDRIEGKAQGNEHAFGVSPAYEEINWESLSFTPEQFAAVSDIDRDAWLKELELHAALFEQLSYNLPQALRDTKVRIEKRLAAA